MSRRSRTLHHCCGKIHLYHQIQRTPLQRWIGMIRKAALLCLELTVLSEVVNGSTIPRGAGKTIFDGMSDPATSPQ